MGPSLPHEKQYQHKENDSYRFAQTDLSQHVQHGHDCGSKPVMKPCGNPLIGALKGFAKPSIGLGCSRRKNGV